MMSVQVAYRQWPMTQDQQTRISLLRSMLKSVAVAVLENTESSREQGLALTRLEEAFLWAQAAIERVER